MMMDEEIVSDGTARPLMVRSLPVFAFLDTS